MPVPHPSLPPSLPGRIADALAELLRDDAALSGFFDQGGGIHAAELEDLRFDGPVQTPSLWVVIDGDEERRAESMTADESVTVALILVTSARHVGEGAPWKLTGTVDVSGTSVTGTGTDFEDEVEVDDKLRIDGEVHQVASIASDTALTLATSHSGATGETAEYIGHGADKWIRSRVFSRIKRVIRALDSGVLRDPGNSDPTTNRLTESLTGFQRIGSGRIRRPNTPTGGSAWIVTPMLVNFVSTIDEVTGDPLL